MIANLISQCRFPKHRQTRGHASVHSQLAQYQNDNTGVQLAAFTSWGCNITSFLILDHHWVSVIVAFHSCKITKHSTYVLECLQ